MASAAIKAHWMSGNWIGVFVFGKVKAFAEVVVNVFSSCEVKANVDADGDAC